jgi:cytochrome c biogenesis protein CcmG, thiol:disulfide interchange protein DsbE
VVVIGIDTGESGDPMERAARFQAEHQLTYPILVDRDGAAQQAFGVRAFPTNVVIDRHGYVRFAGAGFDRPAIDHALDALTHE